MGVLRDRSSDAIAELDLEIKAAVSRLHQIPDRDVEQRQLVGGQIDDLLDRRLQLEQDRVIRAHERLISAF